MALDRPSNGVGVRFVKINGSGKVTGSKLVSLPPGVTIGRIACTRLTSCEVAGNDIFASPETIEVGSWNGKRLTLHRVSSVKGTTNPIIEAVACAGNSCDVVGYVQKNATNIGVILTVSHGKPKKLHTATGDSLYGVACVSASRCYASGFTRTGGLVLTLSNGVPSSPQHVTPDLFGIACNGSACTAAREQLPGSRSREPWSASRRAR